MRTYNEFISNLDEETLNEVSFKTLLKTGAIASLLKKMSTLHNRLKNSDDTNEKIELLSDQIQQQNLLIAAITYASFKT